MVSKLSIAYSDRRHTSSLLVPKLRSPAILGLGKNKRLGYGNSAINPLDPFKPRIAVKTDILWSLLAPRL